MSSIYKSKAHGHGKVVRDVIETGKQLAPEERVPALSAKIFEEVNELLEAITPEEIAEEAGDLIEVALEYCKAKGVDVDAVLAAGAAKHEQKGGFEQLNFLPLETIYSRPECIFNYCPHPESCKSKDKCILQ